jgi:hypothetical protein
MTKQVSMNRNKSGPMDCTEFEECTQKVVRHLGSESIRFFTTIHDLERYFLESDAIIKRTALSLKEFEEIGKKIAGFLGEEESARFFKSLYDMIPQKTLSFMGMLVKLFERAESYDFSAD